MYAEGVITLYACCIVPVAVYNMQEILYRSTCVCVTLSGELYIFIAGVCYGVYECIPSA